MNLQFEVVPPRTFGERRAAQLYDEVKHVLPPQDQLPADWHDSAEWSGTAKAFWLYDWRVRQGLLPRGTTADETAFLAGFVTERAVLDAPERIGVSEEAP